MRVNFCSLLGCLRSWFCGAWFRPCSALGYIVAPSSWDDVWWLLINWLEALLSSVYCSNVEKGMAHQRDRGATNILGMPWEYPVINIYVGYCSWWPTGYAVGIRAKDGASNSLMVLLMVLSRIQALIKLPVVHSPSPKVGSSYGASGGAPSDHRVP